SEYPRHSTSANRRYASMISIGVRMVRASEAIPGLAGAHREPGEARLCGEMAMRPTWVTAGAGQPARAGGHSALAPPRCRLTVDISAVRPCEKPPGTRAIDHALARRLSAVPTGNGAGSDARAIDQTIACHLILAPSPGARQSSARCAIARGLGR